MLGDMPFCPVRVVRRVAGMPPMNTLKLPRNWRSGPMNMPEATPIDTPASSPLLIVPWVRMFSASPKPTMTLNWDGTCVIEIAKFGNGIGTGPTGVGTMHTSGNAKLSTASEMFPNMISPHADALGIHLDVLLRGHHRLLAVQAQQARDV